MVTTGNSFKVRSDKCKAISVKEQASSSFHPVGKVTVKSQHKTSRKRACVVGSSHVVLIGECCPIHRQAAIPLLFTRTKYWGKIFNGTRAVTCNLSDQG